MLEHRIRIGWLSSVSSSPNSVKVWDWLKKAHSQFGSFLAFGDGSQMPTVSGFSVAASQIAVPLIVKVNAMQSKNSALNVPCNASEVNGSIWLQQLSRF